MEKQAYIADNYASIYKKLKKTTTTFLKSKDIEELKNFILKQRKTNHDGLKNSLIEIPCNNNIKSRIEKDYTSIDYLDGVLGTVDATDQFDGITNMALLMLMSNRLAKHFRYKNNKNLSTDDQKLCKKNEATLLRWKDLSMKDLIASLYVLNQTEPDYKEVISYGYRKDDIGNDSFVIDLPYFGQVCVHFGHKMQTILDNAQETVLGILESKLELGQLSQKDFETLKDNLDATTILPDYTGKLYEYTAGLPIEYEGNKIKDIKKSLGLDKKLPEDIQEEDLVKIQQSSLNSREAYYFAIKLGLSKTQLEKVVQMDSTYLDARKIGKSAFSSTTAEERSAIFKQELAKQMSQKPRELNQ